MTGVRLPAAHLLASALGAGLAAAVALRVPSIAVALIAVALVGTAVAAPRGRLAGSLSA